MPRKPSETVQVNLRMKEAMRRHLAQAAENRGISLNAEMVRRIEDSFDQESNRSLEEIAHDMRTSADSVVAATKILQSAAKLLSGAMLQASAHQNAGKLSPEATPEATQFSAAWRQKSVAAQFATIEELRTKSREISSRPDRKNRRAANRGAHKI